MDHKSRVDVQDDEQERRRVPPIIQKLLAADVQLTKRVVAFSLNFVAFRSMRQHCKFLEYSCHGLIWLAGWLAFIWMWDSPRMYQMQMNMFLGLILDIVFVAVLKALTRRRRPTINDDIFSLGPDKFSFPSGHASRAFYILFFFTILDPVSYIFWPPMFAWAVSVAFSRLLLCRHHILDVVAGALLGVFEILVMTVLWMNADTAKWMMSWLSDENLPGSATQDGLL